MPYTGRFSLRAKTVKIVSLLLIRLLPRAAKATFPHKGRLTQSVIKQKFEAVKHTYKQQFSRVQAAYLDKKTLSKKNLKNFKKGIDK